MRLMDAAALTQDVDFAARQTMVRYRNRRRRGALSLRIEVEPHVMWGLEKLGLLAVGERDPTEVAAAVMQFLAAAGPVADIGNAIWSERDDSE
jgi:hypothetical protein